MNIYIEIQEKFIINEIILGNISLFLGIWILYR